MADCEYCTICNAPLNEDGTTELCAGECDRQVLPEYSPMKELNFDEENTHHGFNDLLPEDDPYSYENLQTPDDVDDWIPELEEWEDDPDRL